jgi:type IV secretory pathway TrbL component
LLVVLFVVLFVMVLVMLLFKLLLIDFQRGLESSSLQKNNIKC